MRHEAAAAAAATHSERLLRLLPLLILLLLMRTTSLATNADIPSPNSYRTHKWRNALRAASRYSRRRRYYSLC